MDLKTFKDMLQQRDRMLHEHAMWLELREHLSKFLDGDSVATSVGIHSKGSGGVVPQDIIMEAQLQIDTTLDGLQKEIEAIEKLEVAKNESSSEKKQEGNPASGSTSTRKKWRKANPAAGAS